MKSNNTIAANDSINQQNSTRHHSESLLSSALLLAGIVLVYFAGAVLSPLQTPLQNGISYFWILSGIGLVIVLRFDYRIWLSLTLLVLLVAYFGSATPSVALISAASSMLQAIIGAWLLRRADFHERLERIRDVLSLIVLAGLVATTISTTFGVAVICMFGIMSWDTYFSVWRPWWLGNILSVLVISPLLLVWTAQQHWRRSHLRIAEAGVSFLGVIAMFLLFFHDWPGLEQLGGFALFFVLPPLLWMAIRFGPQGATATLTLLLAIAAWHTSHGHGLFASQWNELSLALTLCAFFVITATTLLAAATFSELRQAQRGADDYQTHQHQVAELSRLQAALKQRESRLTDFAYSTADWFWETDADLRYSWLSDNYEAVSGVSPMLILGKQRADFVNNEQLSSPHWQNHLAQLAARQPFRNFEFRVDWKQINAWLRISGVPMFDESGNFQGYRGVTANITSLREAEQRTAQTQERFMHAIEAVPIPLALFDAADRLIICNKAFGLRDPSVANLVKPGATFEEITRAKLAAGEYLDAVGREESWLHQRMQYHRQPDAPVFRAKTKSGIWEVIENTLPDGSLFLITIDITELTKKEEELRIAKESAEEANRNRGEFLAKMSHEIRNPLSGILGMVELLFNTALDRQQRQYLQSVESAGATLLEIITDVLDFAKIETGKLTIAETDFDPRELIEGVVQMLAGRAQLKGLSLRAEIDPAMPQVLCSDPARLRQVLINFVSNAITHTERGHVKLRLRVMKQDASHVSIRGEVEDTGIGIEPELCERIFSAYTQIANPKRVPAGTGLGLAICKEIINIMGGDIGVDSTPRRGSTFWFTLTLKMVNIPIRTPAPTSVTFAQRLGLTVLVVEDNPVNQEISRLFLEQLGCRALVAEDGYQALSMLTEHSFDLILMDCQMPGLSGFETATEIRRREQEQNSQQHKIIIAMTADVMGGIVERCRNAGMDDYLSKPFSQQQLFDILKRWQVSIAKKVNMM